MSTRRRWFNLVYIGLRNLNSRFDGLSKNCSPRMMAKKHHAPLQQSRRLLQLEPDHGNAAWIMACVLHISLRVPQICLNRWTRRISITPSLYQGFRLHTSVCHEYMQVKRRRKSEDGPPFQNSYPLSLPTRPKGISRDIPGIFQHFCWFKFILLHHFLLRNIF